MEKYIKPSITAMSCNTENAILVGSLMNEEKGNGVQLIKAQGKPVLHSEINQVMSIQETKDVLKYLQ